MDISKGIYLKHLEKCGMKSWFTKLLIDLKWIGLSGSLLKLIESLLSNGQSSK